MTHQIQTGEGKTSYKVELVALALLIPLALILGLILWRQPSFSPVASTTPLATSPTPSESPANPNEASVEGITDTKQAPTISPANEEISNEPAETNVIMVIEGPTGTSSHGFLIDFPATVADVLAQARESGIAITTKDYGGTMGLFVESMMGVNNDLNQQLYWTLYINDTLSQVGASSAQVKAGDNVTWRYERLSNNN